MAIIDDYQLTDRYVADAGRVFVTGIQAAARIPIEQLRVDRLTGLNTAAFVSGYQGSPLAGFDMEVARAAKTVPGLPVVHRPGLNEELAATSVMGTQLAAEQPDSKYDGVIGMWYGKAPGLDRASDAIRHAVYAGTSRHGGAIVLVGDDPEAKSSTLPSSSDRTLVDLHMPIFYPGDVQETLDLGRHAVALSRVTGLWTSIKLVANVADGTGTIDLSPDRVDIQIPDLMIDGVDYVHEVDAVLVPPHNLLVERDLREVRMELAMRYAAANQLNRVTVDPPDPWVGIVATGFTYHEMIEALRRLGLDSPEAIADAGIRVMHMQLPHPFDPNRVRAFAAGLEEIIVVEEKNPTLELLIKDALYGHGHHPLIWGKHDEDGTTLMPNHGVLDADTMIDGLRRHLERRLADRLAPPPPPERERHLIPVAVNRTPAFCSGCPHNWGSKVPDGSLVGAGIGCHTMVLLMDDERVGTIAGLTAMGGEGSQWIGMSPFVERDHFIQNLGDGTYFHSGQLAINAAIAAGVNVTYKLLYNGAVAMTGGQDAVGQLAVPDVAEILVRQGVKRVLITTDDVGDYEDVELPHDAAGQIEVWDRTRIVEAQEILAGVEGVTVLINDQACAAEVRRARKRGEVPMPTERVVINHRICEACGDCGRVSNCLSVQPIDTPLGIKTTIDQGSCNLDFSCLHGDCPSFMTVEPAEDAEAMPEPPPAPTRLPAPVLRVDPSAMTVRIVGIGGTGVVTAAQVVATGAMLDGFDVRGLDQTGLSQKAGAVVSDLRLRKGGAPATNLIGDASADVMLAFDLLTASTETALSACRADHTIVAGSSSVTPTASMIGHPELAYPSVEDLLRRVAEGTATGEEVVADAARMTGVLVGNPATSNLFVIGLAHQAGLLPVSAHAIESAIALNGVAVDANTSAFRWGRAFVADRQATESVVAEHAGAIAPDVAVDPLPHKLVKRTQKIGLDTNDRTTLHVLTADLVGYQSSRYARQFLDSVERVARAERASGRDVGPLTMAVARSLHKLMAYKDEYEVARLLLGPETRAAAEVVAGPGATISWRLHPPMLKALGLDHKIGLSEKVGRPMMAALIRGRRLRGTKLDPFGHTAMRKAERELIAEYLDVVESELTHLAGGVDDGEFDRIVEVAELPMDIRGFEELKMERIAEFRERVAARTVERRASSVANA
jgi:indolepyruvate ferredoxin oxidoreductase